MPEHSCSLKGDTSKKGIFTNVHHVLKKYAVVWSIFIILVVTQNVGSLPVEPLNTVSIALNLETETGPIETKQSVLGSKTDDKVCSTPRCLELAENIKKTLNASADPCTDFYEYACGGWIKKTKIPKHRAQYSTISELSENNERILQESLETNQTIDTETIMKVKNFYRSCMDMETIDNLGSKPLLEYIDSLGSWELSENWNAKKWDFHKVLRHMHKNYPAEILFTVDVIADPVKKREDKKYIAIVSYQAREFYIILSVICKNLVNFEDPDLS